MRTGTLARVALLLLTLVSVIVAMMAAVSRDVAESGTSRLDLPPDLLTAAFIVGGVGVVLGIIGYVILTELQFQTTIVLASMNQPPLPPPDAAPSSTEPRRTIARHDSWS